MSKFFIKLQICLTEPRKIGFFMGEKKWKTLFQLLILMLVALSPLFIKLSLKDGFSEESIDYIQESLMFNDIDADIVLRNGKLEGDNSILIGVNEAVVFINPNNQLLSDKQYSNYTVFELGNDNVNVYIEEKVVYSATYEELEYLDIDFNKIMKSNYLEFNRFISLLNRMYQETNSYWVIFGFGSAFINSCFSLIICALLLALMSSVINPSIKFKYRFKGALDAQFIYILFLLFRYLFDVEILEYIGILFTSIYLFRALSSILRIEVRKIKKESGEN